MISLQPIHPETRDTLGTVLAQQYDALVYASKAQTLALDAPESSNYLSALTLKYKTILAMSNRHPKKAASIDALQQHVAAIAPQMLSDVQAVETILRQFGITNAAVLDTAKGKVEQSGGGHHHHHGGGHHHYDGGYHHHGFNYHPGYAYQSPEDAALAACCEGSSAASCGSH